MEPKVQYSINLCNKYSKELLCKMEAYYEVERLPTELRKLVLDAFNDLAREQTKVLVDNVLTRR